MTLPLFVSLFFLFYLDLKPENIMLKSDRDDTQIMLADFGLGAFALPDQAMKLPCGTLTFTAPEVLTGKGYGMEVDMWSCGVLAFVLLRGSLPFDGKNAEEIREKTIHGRYSFDHPIWGEVTDECKDFIRKLLTVDPTQRLASQQALEHPFFKLKYPTVTAIPGATTTATVTGGSSAPTNTNTNGASSILPPIQASGDGVVADSRSLTGSPNPSGSGSHSRVVPSSSSSPTLPIILPPETTATELMLNTSTPSSSVYGTTPIVHNYDSSPFNSLSRGFPLPSIGKSNDTSYANSLTSSLTFNQPSPRGPFSSHDDSSFHSSMHDRDGVLLMPTTSSASASTSASVTSTEVAPPVTRRLSTDEIDGLKAAMTRTNESDTNIALTHAANGDEFDPTRMSIPIEEDAHAPHRSFEDEDMVDHETDVISPLASLHPPRPSSSASPVHPNLVLTRSPNSISSQLVLNARDSSDDEDDRPPFRRTPMSP